MHTWAENRSHWGERYLKQNASLRVGCVTICVICVPYKKSFHNVKKTSPEATCYELSLLFGYFILIHQLKMAHHVLQCLPRNRDQPQTFVAQFGKVSSSWIVCLCCLKTAGRKWKWCKFNENSNGDAGLNYKQNKIHITFKWIQPILIIRILYNSIHAISLKKKGKNEMGFQIY